MSDPLIITGVPTIRAVCKLIHKDFLKKFNYAKIWGKSAKFDGQTVGLKHILNNEDVVELHTKR
jgi:ribosome-interacting GTPase 1